MTAVMVLEKGGRGGWVMGLWERTERPGGNEKFPGRQAEWAARVNQAELSRQGQPTEGTGGYVTSPSD